MTATLLMVYVALCAVGYISGWTYAQFLVRGGK